ncbi:MAG: hypothetical protein ACOX0L_09590 [Natronincolaceae bacterium]|mgnify:CR=1 FL=1|jgi:predicted nuclease with TOPRIM domain|nr:hypothetical protein [Clostridiales bacterium]
MGKEITNEQLFEFMTKIYGEMQDGFEEVKNEVKKTNIKIDHEIMPKIDALFDGYKQNSEKLDRIEKEVSRHEEIILRRIK